MFIISALVFIGHHILLSGLGAPVTVFDEKKIVAGDIVKTELDPEVFQMMQQAAGLRNTGNLKVLGVQHVRLV